MKLFTNIKFVALVAILAAIPFVAGVYTEKAAAHNGETHTAQAQNQDQSANTPAATYEYVAQPNDTYSQMARKAIQTYGIVNKVNLSSAQIIYAETLLTQAANSPMLAKGQKVSIRETDVKRWVDKAQKLTDAQKKAWQAYTVGVNFNTNNVGVAPSATS